MCILEECGVFPGLLHAKSERCTGWRGTSNKPLERKGDRAARAAQSNVIPYTALTPGASLGSPPRKP